MRSYPALLTALAASAALLGACGLLDESKGKCTGHIGEHVVDLTIDGVSEFHNDSLGDTELSLRYGDYEVGIDGTLDGASSQLEERTYALPLDGAAGDPDVEYWYASITPSDPYPTGGTLTLEVANASDLVGSFTYTYADDTSFTCDFHLLRDSTSDAGSDSDFDWD